MGVKKIFRTLLATEIAMGAVAAIAAQGREPGKAQKRTILKKFKDFNSFY